MHQFNLFTLLSTTSFSCIETFPEKRHLLRFVIDGISHLDGSLIGYSLSVIYIALK